MTIFYPKPVPTLPAFTQTFNVNFTKVTNVNEKVVIDKAVGSTTMVIGNLGNANADAKAFGYDTLAETLTLTSAIQGQASTAFSESTSATNGAWGLAIWG
jgi:hypothetical protein